MEGSYSRGHDHRHGGGVNVNERIGNVRMEGMGLDLGTVGTLGGIW